MIPFLVLAVGYASWITYLSEKRGKLEEKAVKSLDNSNDQVRSRRRGEIFWSYYMEWWRYERDIRWNRGDMRET